MTDTDDTVEVQVTPDLLQRAVVIIDGKPVLATLITNGVTRWFGRDLLTYRVEEDDELVVLTPAPASGRQAARRPQSLAEYDRLHDNGCSVCRNPDCDNPGGQH